MKRSLVRGILGVGFISLMVGSSFAQNAKTLDDPDAYAIYSMVLRNQIPIREAQMKLVLLTAETHNYGSDLTRCLANEPNTAADVASLVRSYQAKNESWRFEQKFDLPIPYELVKEETFKDYFKDPNAPSWKNFFGAYPGSGYFFNLSQITFDVGKTRALVSVGYGCAFNCGKSSYHLLEKHDGKWLEVPFLTGSYSCGVVF